MNISGINYESVVDGQGIRVVVYVSGCAHNCEGCHNPSSHPFDAGIEFSEKLQDDVIKCNETTLVMEDPYDDDDYYSDEEKSL